MTRFLALVLLLACWGAAWAVGGETFYVFPKTQCTFNGNGLANQCAASNLAAGAKKGSNNLTFGASAGQVDAGDTVYFVGTWTGTAAGESGNDTYMMSNGAGASGSAGNLITWDYTSAIIDCNREVQRGLSFGAVHHFVIKNPTIKNCGVAGAYGIYLAGDGTAAYDLSATIESPTITNIIAADGLTVAIRAKGANVTIHNPKINGVSDDGIWVDGDNVLTYCDAKDGIACYIKNVGLGAAVTGDCVQYGATAATSLAGEVRKVYCDHQEVNEKQCFITNGLGLLKVTESVCLLPDYDGSTLTNGIYTEGTVFAEANYFRGGRLAISTATQAGATGTANTMRSNIMARVGLRGISLGSGTLATITTTAANNSINCANFSGASAIYLDGVAGSTAIVKNNDIINCPLPFNGVGANVVETIANNNDYLSGAGRFTSVTDGGNNTTADPLHMGGDNPVSSRDFDLLPTSPLIHEGEYLGLYPGYNCGFEPRSPEIGAMARCAGSPRGTALPARTTPLGAAP